MALVDEQLRAVFASLDTDGDGFIEAAALQSVAASMNPEVSGLLER